MAKLYVFQDDDGRGIIHISAYHPDDPKWENNHVDVSEMGRGVPNRHNSAMNILTNVLRDAGIEIDYAD